MPLTLCLLDNKEFSFSFFSSEDMNSSSYGEFLRRYYQWCSEMNRKNPYSSPSAATPVAPLPHPTSVPPVRPAPSAYDPLLHYEYMQRTVPYYLSPGFYPSHAPSVLPTSGVKLPTPVTGVPYSPSSFVPPGPHVPPVSSHMLNSSFSPSLPSSLHSSLPSPIIPTSACGGTTVPLKPVETLSGSNDCALAGMKRSYEATYLDLDSVSKAEKQRKLTDSMLSSSAVAASSYLPYPGLPLSTPSYLGWDRRVPPTSVDHTTSLLEYERHRHLDPLGSSMLAAHHSSSPFGMRPFMDSCKGMFTQRIRF